MTTLARIVGALTLVLLPFGAAALERSQLGQYHALIIGNNGYRHLTKLKTAQEDATAVARLLQERYGFDTEILVDATRADIIDKLAELRAKLTESDNLLIYYAGHGHLDQDSGEGYWLPVDAEPDNPTNWVSNRDITDQLKAMSVRHVMVVADSCYAGTLTRDAGVELKSGAEREEWLSRMAERPSRTALTSGGLEPVSDSGGGQHSVFARAFIDALEDNREVLDGQSLFDDVKGPVVANAAQTPGYETIREAGDHEGDFLFVPLDAEPATGKAAAPAAPAETRGARQVDERALELAFWDSIKDSTDPAAYREFLKQFPDGTFAGLAKLKIKELTGEKTAAPIEQKTAAVIVPPPSPAPSPAEPAVGVYPKVPGAGESFRDCANCPEMVVVPGGEFVMGSPASESGRDGDEGPTHLVTILEPFAIGRYEVSFAEWDACRAEGGCARRLGDRGWGRGNRPAINLSWHDAQDYVAWLSRKTGHRYRLPSEAEWEHAARGGTRTARYWGEEIGAGRANCDGCGSRWDDSSTAPVGSFAPNPFGLHDVLGNVWEWVEDCYIESYREAPPDGSARVAGDCRLRVMRGGSWESDPRRLRAANRQNHGSRDIDDDFGLRVARSLAE